MQKLTFPENTKLLMKLGKIIWLTHCLFHQHWSHIPGLLNSKEIIKNIWTTWQKFRLKHFWYCDYFTMRIFNPALTELNPWNKISMHLNDGLIANASLKMPFIREIFKTIHPSVYSWSLHDRPPSLNSLICCWTTKQKQLFPELLDLKKYLCNQELHIFTFSACSSTFGCYLWLYYII